MARSRPGPATSWPRAAAKAASYPSMSLDEANQRADKLKH
jgi:hypothetical protein